MTTTVPENIIRAVANSPESHIKDVFLGSIGIGPDYAPITDQEREDALEALDQLVATAEPEMISLLPQV